MTAALPSPVPRGRFSAAHPECIRDRDRRYPVDRIVIHTMEGSLAGTERWFRMGPGERARANLSKRLRGVDPTAQQVRDAIDAVVMTAAHFLIGRDGSTVQMVLETKKCFHAGTRRQPGWNDRSIGIELEAVAGVGDFPAPLLAAAARLVAESAKRRGIPLDRTHIVGHAEVPGATHTDPGPHFPWEHFMDLVLAAAA